MNNKKCSVKDCSSTSRTNGINFFHFPRNIERQQTWIDFCRNPILKSQKPLYLQRHFFVCEHHFKSEDFKTPLNNSLVFDRNPSIYWPISRKRTSSPIGNSPKKQCTSNTQHNNISPTRLQHIEHKPSTPPTTQSQLLLTLKTPPPTPSHHNTSSTPNPSDVESINLPFDSYTDQFVDDSTEVEGICDLNEADSLSTATPLSTSSVQTAALRSQTPSTSKGRALTLADIQMTRKKQLLLSPRKRFLYGYAKRKERALANLKTKIGILRRRSMSIKDILELDPDEFAKTVRSSQKMSKASAIFVKSQLRCSVKKPMARRWTLEEKVMALALYKKSPKSYRLLRCMFALPCPKTLNSLLCGVPFETGINAQIFTTLASIVRKLENCDKSCILLFDEMAIRENLTYNSSLDRIVGVEDYGDHGRTSNLANQALVFMVKGLLKKWKQPVAYYFSNGGVSAEILVDLIKSVLSACTQAGLHVIATVCDLGSSQAKALRLLGSTRGNPQFQFDGRGIITLYDPPHLIKCIRNQLRLHNIHCTYKVGDKVVEGIASWKVIEETYEKDKLAEPFRWLWKLTDSHINPSGRKKMRVKLATQVLSHSVAASIYRDVACGVSNSEALATGYLVEFCDKLFDSFNGSKDERCKPLRQVLKDNSPHLEFWEQVVKEVDSWKIESSRKKSKKSKFQRPPSQNGVIQTVNGFRKLWTIVKELDRNGKKIKYLVPRNVSQDALENTFGAIRSNCGNNCVPNVAQFVGALKTCIINGLAYSDVKQGTNCEVDGASLLSDLQSLLVCDDLGTKQPGTSDENNEIPPDDSLLGAARNSPSVDAPRDLSSVAYVSGFIAKKLLAGNSCGGCRAGLANPNPAECCDPGFLFKEYSDDCQRLTYPSEKLVGVVNACANLLEKKLEEHIHQDKIMYTISNIMMQEVEFGWLKDNCLEHYLELKSKISKHVCMIGIPWYCKRQNRKLAEQAKQRFNARRGK